MRKMLFAWFAAVCLISALAVPAQETLFQDDFEGDLSAWQELGNPGAPVIENGELVLEWGYSPNWFVTNDSFNFGSEALQYNFTFVQGGHQATSNYKQNWVRPILGAADPEAGNGAVRAEFSADYFNLQRRAENDAGDMVWERIPFKSTGGAPTVEPGSRVRFEIDESGQNGVMYIDGEQASVFQNTPVLEGGVGFRIVTSTRNVIVDDVYFAQIDSSGAETVILNDDFNRAEVGDGWVNETLAENTSPGPLTEFIENGQLNLVGDGSADAWLRTAAQVPFAGQTTVFEYTFVDYVEGSNYRPSPVLGVKPFEAGATNGVILVDNGSGFNYGLVDGGWAGGQAFQLGANRQGMRFKIVVDAGGQSGTVYRDGVQGIRFFNIGPVFTGAIAFRSIVDRDATLDDVRCYTIEPDGSETTLFEDDFNRDELGEDWVIESITPDVPEGALIYFLEDRDGDGDNEVTIDHDGSLDDSWFRLDKELPFSGDKPVAIEGTYVSYQGLASVVIGSSQWIANEIAGPILLDDLGTPWVMDTREGNVWVRPGPIGGSRISIRVNESGTGGSFLVNGVAVRDWEFEDGEAPIPAGPVGFDDPFTSPTPNEVPPAEPGTVALARYDDISVERVADTPVAEWMVH